jgi:hypothetical protein
MKENTMRRFVDIAMYVLLCFIVGTGLLIGYRLPPCSRGGEHGYTLLSLGRHDWGSLHLWAAYAFMALCIVHLILNFSFIKNVVAAKKLSFLLGISIPSALIIFWFLFATVEFQSGRGKCETETVSPTKACFSCPSRASCTDSNQPSPTGDVREASPEK